MSSFFPHFSVVDIILRHGTGSQDLYCMIINSSITSTTSKAGAHSFYYYVDSNTYLFYLLHKFKMTLTFFRNLFQENSGTTESKNFRNNIPGRSVNPKQRSGNFRFAGKNRSRIPDFRNFLEMEKISGSFPYVIRSPK